MPIPVVRSASPDAAVDRVAKRAKLEPAAGGSSVASLASSILPPLPTTAIPLRSPSKKKQPSAPKINPWPPLSDEEYATLVEAEMAKPIEVPRIYSYELDYRDKLVLAPMVRTGSLPERLLSLYYGAGLVWSPEVVDRAIIGAQRDVDPETGVITYHKGQGPIFTCHPTEKPFLIFQIGSSNPELAVQAAKVVQQDVAGIDLNCGCPKPFSTHAGMGAALLSTPDLLLDILHALLRNIPLPISAKIRMLPQQAPTRLLAAKILRTGIRNLTVHCRTRDMRPAERAMWERLGDIVELGRRRNLPVICNGDGEGWANWSAIREQTGATSVMLARSAERNPSCFSPTGPVCTTSVIIPQLLNLTKYQNNPWGNTKFLLMQFKPSPHPISTMSKAEKKEASQIVARGKTAEDVAAGLKFELDAAKGGEFMAELEKKLSARPEWNVFDERRRAVAAGEVDHAAEEAEANEEAVQQDWPDASAAPSAAPSGAATPVPVAAVEGDDNKAEPAAVAA